VQKQISVTITVDTPDEGTKPSPKAFISGSRVTITRCDGGQLADISFGVLDALTKVGNVIAKEMENSGR
jgi:hypothetical protein